MGTVIPRRPQERLFDRLRKTQFTCIAAILIPRSGYRTDPTSTGHKHSFADMATQCAENKLCVQAVDY